VSPKTGMFRFEQETHIYYLDEQEIPSVTQVLEPLMELEGIPRDILEEAAAFGTHVHEACALMLHKQLEWRTLDPKLVPYVSAAKKFIQEAGVIVLRIEHRMCDPSLKVAGTLDLLGVIDKHTAIIDWKSTATMSKTTGLQLAAYDHLHRRSLGGRPLRRYGVQLRADGDYRLIEYKDSRDANWFFSALNLWWWRNSR
jgi:PD-(D/E)XK nuclease superfamily